MNTQTPAHNVYDRTRFDTFLRIFRRIALCGLMLPLIVGLWHPAQAQSEMPRLAQAADTTIATTPIAKESPKGFVTTSSTWQSNFDEQAAHLLRDQDNATIRNVMLNHVIVVATQHPNAIDLSATVGALLQVCANDPDEQRRLMAIQALHTIGTEHTSGRRYHRAMERLYRLMQDESSNQVRSVAAAALNDFLSGEEM